MALPFEVDLKSGENREGSSGDCPLYFHKKINQTHCVRKKRLLAAAAAEVKPLAPFLTYMSPSTISHRRTKESPPPAKKNNQPQQHRRCGVPVVSHLLEGGGADRQLRGTRPRPPRPERLPNPLCILCVRGPLWGEGSEGGLGSGRGTDLVTGDCLLCPGQGPPISGRLHYAAWILERETRGWTFVVDLATPPPPVLLV